MNIFQACQLFSEFTLGLFHLIEMDFKTEEGEKDEEKKIGQASHNSESNLNASYSKEGSSPYGQRDSPDRSSSGAQEDATNHQESTPQSQEFRNGNRESGMLSKESWNHNENSESGSQASAAIKGSNGEYSDCDNGADTMVDKPNQSNQPSKDKSSAKRDARKQKIKRWLKEMWGNFTTPNSLALIISIAIAMAPPLKALFVKLNFHIPDAPDKQPPLSFVLDLTQYVGNAAVPLGLLMIGATLARIQIKKMPPGFWKTAIALVALRLIVLPIIGAAVTIGFHKGDWFAGDDLLWFVSVLEYCLPSATVLIYLTSSYSDPTSDEHLQMDCLAICLIAQYIILIVALPFTATFTVKVLLRY